MHRTEEECVHSFGRQPRRSLIPLNYYYPLSLLNYSSKTAPVCQFAKAPVAEGVATETSGICYKNDIRCSEVTTQLLGLPLKFPNVSGKKSILIFLLFNFWGITIYDITDDISV
jgi:hypothetical protein